MCQRTESHQAQRRQVWRQKLLQITEKIPNKIKGKIVENRKTYELGTFLKTYLIIRFASSMKNIRKNIAF